MTLTGVKAGDIVKVDKKGRIFYAEVVGRPSDELAILPLDAKRVSYRSAAAREVIGHWRKAKGGRA